MGKKNTFKNNWILLMVMIVFGQTANCFGQEEQTLPQLSESTINDVISAMTLEEKACLVVGAGIKSGLKGEWAKKNPFEPKEGSLAYETENYPVPGIGRTLAITRLGVPSIVMADGPAGVSTSLKGTFYPIETALASTWNDSLVYQLGQCFGNEALEYGVDILLSPAVNIQRNPLNGRNFEYYSEDPLLSGNMGVAMTKGVESKGVGTSLKHFIANNQETNRTTVDAIIGERALRELYLETFRIVIEKAKPWTVMAAYNSVNGHGATENYDLLTKVLKQEWNYKGLVMSDWGAGTDAVAQLKAGLDLIMPGPHQSKDIIKAVREGKLSEDVLDKRVESILKLVLKSLKYKKYQNSNQPDFEYNTNIAQQAATEGMVLLKNEELVLPIIDKSKSIAIFGNGSYVTIPGGSGSGFVMNSAPTINFIEGLNDAGFQSDEYLMDTYKGFIKSNTPRTKFYAGIRGRIRRAPEMQVDRRMAKKMAKEAEVALVTITRNSEEGKDREIEYDFKLSATEKLNLLNISEAFHKKNKKVIVVLNIGSVIETASWREMADAILIAWQPGQVAGDALADIISGKVSPSGKLPMTFPIKYGDVPSANSFPGMPNDDPKTSIYEDGIYVGYRYYNTFGVETAYSFGYGLSYTNFTYSDVKLSSSKFKGSLEVSVVVSNSGSIPGKEVVQLYLSAPTKELHKPVQELKGYGKTNLLKPGEFQTLTFIINAKKLASYNTEKSAWIADKGKYTVKIGASCEDIRSESTFSLSKRLIVSKVSRALVPSMTINEIKGKR